MRYLIISLFTAVLSLNSFSQGMVSSGGGISESNIIYSFQNLESYIDSILDTQILELSNDERKHLSSLHIRAKLETKTKLLFKKKSEYNFNGRKFITKNTIGSDIYINLDSLFTLDGKKKVPLTLSQSIIFNFKIINRDLNILSQSEMESLLNKLSTFFSADTKTFSLSSYDRPELQVSVIKNNFSSHLLLMDSHSLFNYTENIRKSLICINDNSVKELSNLYNLYISEIHGFDSSSNSIKITYSGNIDYSCDLDNETMYAHGIVHFTLTYKLSSSKPEELITDKWWVNKNIQAKIDTTTDNITFRDIYMD